MVIDCQTEDLNRDAEFWGSVFGATVISRGNPEDANYRGLTTDSDAPKTLVQKVDHPSRIHLDIETDNIEQEVQRLIKLGAKKVKSVRGWCIMEAPSGHKFCVVKKRRSDFDSDATVWS